MTRRLRKIIVALLAMALCFALFFVWNHFQNQSFDETFYRVFSQKINEPVRAVYLSDAHQVRFGEKNEKLLEHIRSLEPDIILLGGDLLNDVDPDVDYVIELCQKLVQIAPVFYGLGNHENKVIYDMDLYKDQLEEAGIEEGTEDFSDLVVDCWMAWSSAASRYCRMRMRRSRSTATAF